LPRFPVRPSMPRLPPDMSAMEVVCRPGHLRVGSCRTGVRRCGPCAAQGHLCAESCHFVERSAVVDA
jgi:hypothetical protein